MLQDDLLSNTFIFMTFIKNRLSCRLSEPEGNRKGQAARLFLKQFVLLLSFLPIATLSPASTTAQSVEKQAASRPEAAQSARVQPIMIKTEIPQLALAQSATADSAAEQEVVQSEVQPAAQSLVKQAGASQSIETTQAAAQLTAAQSPEPGGAFLRSLAMPGWGHYYADRQNWNRGKLHLAADILLIAGLTGSVIQERNLHTTYHTQASLKAGVDIKNRGRSFHLAVGGYENLGAYNDYQLRSRNWNRLFPDERENRWEWRSEEDRRHYNELRSRRENAKNRVPMIAGAMVVNRILSAISAYNRARNRTAVPELSVSPVYGRDLSVGGYMGTLRFTY